MPGKGGGKRGGGQKKPPPGFYLPTGPARYSGLRTERPLLFFFYHVEKTGGSAVMKWLYKAAMNVPATLTLLLDLTHTSCLLSMFPDLFPGYTWEPMRCNAELPPDWRTSAIAIEFHGYSRGRFWTTVLPALSALRQRYAAANGTLLTATMLREPVRHLVSSYHMWPPNTKRPGGRKVVVPLPAYVALPTSAGLQAGSIAVAAYVHTRRGFHNPRGCTIQAEAMRRLDTFDLVGPTLCMRPLLVAWGRALGWRDNATRLDLALEAAIRLKPHGVSPHGTLFKQAQTYSYALLNDSSRAQLYETSRCDHALYVHMISRLQPSGAPSVPALGTDVDKSTCEALASGTGRSGRGPS